MTRRASSFDPTERVRLGRSNVRVTRLGLGTVPLSGQFEAVSHDDARAVLETTWDAGVRFFDLAPLYGYGFAERVAGEFLRRQPRDAFVLSTKVGRLLLTDGPADHEDRTVIYRGVRRFPGADGLRPYFDFSYDGVMRSIDASRERMGIDRFDVLHIHDPEHHFDEASSGAVRALEELRGAGVVGAIGVGSNRWEPELAMTDIGDFDTFLLAGRYTLMDQSALPELLPRCQERGIAVIAAGVFNSGILAHPDPASIGAISREAADIAGWKESVTYDYEPADGATIERIGRVKAVCGRHGVPLAAAAIQFPLHHPAIPCVIVGSREVGHVAANDAALRFPIPDDVWAELKHEGLLPEEAPTP